MAISTQPTESRLSLPEARTIIEDLFTPNPLIYWADFLGSVGLGMVCFGIVRRSPLGSVQPMACFVATGLLYTEP
jgi:hypothetical protein